jgi:hypothetical protein
MKNDKYPYFISPKYNSYIYRVIYQFDKPKLNAIKPVWVESEEGSSYISYAIWGFVILGVIGILTLTRGKTGDLLLIIGFYGALLSWIIRGIMRIIETRSWNKKMGIHNTKIDSYNLKVEIFEELVTEYSHIKSVFTSRDLSHKYEAARYLISENDCNIINEGYWNDVKKGKMEDWFYAKLDDFFGEKIIYGGCVKMYNGREYYPDYIYVEEDKGLYIDIEIDEPYTLKDYNPIHTIGDNKDRDDFFESQYWGVIRFSENQIRTHPNQCLALIEKFVENIIREKPIPKWPESFEKRWDREMSIEMANRQYRK